MKALLDRAYRSHHALEVIFSSLRWFFLVLSIGVFSVQYVENPNEDKLFFFIVLVVFGFIYMGVSDYYLHKTPEGSKMYTLMTKCGPFFDFIAFSALIPLTGGLKSPLFPLAYLIILHVAVYWRFLGGMIAAGCFTLVYSIIFFMQAQDATSIHSMIDFFSAVFFLLLIGGLGGIIVSRERKHQWENSILVEAANRDYLTNLANHRSFQECLRKDLEQGKEFYLALTDIDKFKSINDKYGHVTGDRVLRQIGEILTTVLSNKQGKAFRYGGEEFALILYYHDEKEVKELLDEIKEAVASHNFYDKGEAFSVTMSFGSGKQNGERPDLLVEKVDKLLYIAKNGGRNRIVWAEVG
ncbi:GGDEF domain-containing protein [Sutcliffiella horikoshii]|uniref:GGDEF domain-containing protein n=1 Tax=Sutcliffiella horikoshii TaxID=79883 RepID=UPI001F39FCA1|nr:GGDEF domain-containing protein [Sutcliffiella horikoshii]MCG1021147.1 GGDEF domain-containing protein [Sutcliffiella horikoshii]